MSHNPRLTNNQTITASYTLDDNLVVYGQNTYTYDDGYLTEKTTPNGTTTYTYGTLGELLEVTTPTKTITYKHNANNQRVAKLINGVVVEKYLWADLTTLLAIYDANDTLKERFEYVNGRMPVAMTDANNTKYYLHYDQIGSLRAISRVLSPDNTVEVVKQITYDTFGNILTDTNPTLKVPFGFAGGLYDVDTKLTRFGYRDYDAYTGKWTAKDPIGFQGRDSNLYGYVLGDPVNFIDSKGLYIDPRLKDKGVPSVMGDNSNSPWLGLSDMWDNYQKMKKADTKGIDKYFHCLANCHATNRGIGGKNMAKSISDFREWYQEPFDGVEACEADQIANRQGRKGGNCAKTCEQFKPSWMPDWVEQ